MFYGLSGLCTISEGPNLQRKTINHMKTAEQLKTCMLEGKERLVTKVFAMA